MILLSFLILGLTIFGSPLIKTAIFNSNVLTIQELELLIVVKNHRVYSPLSKFVKKRQGGKKYS